MNMSKFSVDDSLYDERTSKKPLSTTRGKRKFHSKRLPEIKVNNMASMQDLFMTEEEMLERQQSDAVCGPSPGVVHLATSRRKVAPTFSFNRIRVRQSFSTSRPHLSIDKPFTAESSFLDSEPSIQFPRIDSAEHSTWQVSQGRKKLLPIHERSI